MKVLEQLDPKSVFGFFEELCAIPHGSGNTAAASAYCVQFAARRGLRCESDDLGNVIIWKPAAPGYETAAPVILQGHLDMVCEKAPGCKKDLQTEGLELAVEGDRVFAKGTTLGGDDGIAVAMMLALLEDAALQSPALEAVFTVDEEIGMLGAAALDLSGLEGRRLLNIDSEEEGVFTVSCAGGNRTACTLPVQRESMPGVLLAVTVSGLAGGHSGTEIGKGRASANQLMGRLLAAAEEECGARLVSVAGGQKDNVIPNESAAVVAVPNEASVRKTAERMAKAFAEEYRAADPGVCVTVANAKSACKPMTAESSHRVIGFLACAPWGVQAMSMEIEGLVQTSLNLGILTTSEEAVQAVFSIRSSVSSQKEMQSSLIGRLADAFGGASTVSSDYPAWEYLKDSPLRQLMTEVYEEQYGSKPTVEAIHAGLECGLFCGKLDGLDCVSIGPDLTEIHTCREAMSISSVQRVFRFVKEVLRRCQ